MVNNWRGIKKPVVLITGASGGLGQKLSLCFAEAGYAVALHYWRHEKAARRVALRIRQKGGLAETVQADVGDRAAVQGMIDAVDKTWGRLDVLIHSAGSVHPGLLVRMDVSAFEEAVRTHLKGAFLCTQAAAPIIKKQKRGCIVYVGSILGARGAAGNCAYAAAKAGLTGLAKSAARELGPAGICVNVVFPGFMRTPMGRSAPVEQQRLAKSENVLNRWTAPGETARKILELCRSGWISGQVFNLDARIL